MGFVTELNFGVKLLDHLKGKQEQGKHSLIGISSPRNKMELYTSQN